MHHTQTHDQLNHSSIFPSMSHCAYGRSCIQRCRACVEFTRLSAVITRTPSIHQHKTWVQTQRRYKNNRRTCIYKRQRISKLASHHITHDDVWNTTDTWQCFLRATVSQRHWPVTVWLRYHWHRTHVLQESGASGTVQLQQHHCCCYQWNDR